MCWEDVRISRRLERKTSRKTLAGAGPELVAAGSPLRVGIIIASGGGRPINVGFESVPPGATFGFPVTVEQGIGKFLATEYGPLVTENVYVDPDVQTPTITIVELFLPNENPFTNGK